MKSRHVILLTLGAFAVIACDELVSDPTFDTWCGDQLCDWQVETGSVSRAKTWHSGDDGVELVGSPVSLSQQLRTSSGEMTLRIAADLDASANVAIEIDLGDDGALDYSNVIPAGPPWSVQSMTIDLPRSDRRTRLRIHKRGSGKARIGRLSLESGSLFGPAVDVFLQPCESPATCPTAFCDLQAANQTGFCSFCRSDTDCAQDRYCDRGPDAELPGSCVVRPVESGCTRDEDCPEGTICGADGLDQIALSRLGSAARDLLTEFGECKALASVAVDHACRADRECSSGICCTNERRPISLCVGDRSRCSF
ncbi:MAG TPA: dickkopf-related protein [Polyangiaceae bacterium]